jgi:hypothetical protein
MISPKIKRGFELALIGVFVVAVGVPFWGTLFADKQVISASEKRQLAVFPEFDWSYDSHIRIKKAYRSFSKALGTFTKAFEEYYNDHFFMRFEMVSLNSLLRIRLFGTSPSFMGLVGSESWLFLVGDGELHDFLRRDTLTDEKLNIWHQVVEQRRLFLSGWDGYYLLAVAPNKSVAYAEHLPDRIVEKRGLSSELAMLSDYFLKSKVSENFLDLSPVLLREKDNGQVYFKTDTHWTDRGAYFAYRKIINQVQVKYPHVVPVPFERLEFSTDRSRSGDLALMMGLLGYLNEDVEVVRIKEPCAEPDTPYQPNKQAEDYYLTKSSCGRASGLRVLVIGDSFVDGVKKYLSETFAEVVYSREKEFNELKDFIGVYRPDIILHLHVARFVDRACVLDPELSVMR